MVEILLATYNGGKYLKTQLQSLIDQTFEDMHVTISDDNSSDNTIDIIDEFIKLYPDKITLVRNEVNSGSASGNFMKMLGQAKDKEYVMLCDQDDFWEKDKVKNSLKAIKMMEEKYGKDVPLLVHGDLTITDANLYVTQTSMFDHQKLNRKIKGFKDELSQNSITGCTVIVNNALLQKFNADCPNVIMHDWYLGLLATAFGHVGFIRRPYIKYRQHGDNQEGAKDFTSVFSSLGKAFGRKSIKASLEKTYIQAEGFKEVHYDELSVVNKQLLDDYISLKYKNKLSRYKTAFSNGFTKTGLNRKLGYWLYL